MSPAPARRRSAPTTRFPQAWGYWVGAFLILAGFVVGAVVVFTGVNSLIDDVNDLRRTASQDGLEATLQRGAEIFVYDEDGLDAGPFDVRVIRTSDDTEIATQRVDDGPSYDIDGREGEARVSFDVPTSDIYRIEVDTSLGEIASFAVGGDVGTGRASRIIQGVVIGAIMALVGFLVIVWTSIMHARFRIRGAVLDSVGSARKTVRETADTGPGAIADEAGSRAGQATTWAQDRLAQARSRLDETGSKGGLRGQASAAAQAQLERIDQVLVDAEQTVRDAASTSDTPVDVADRIDAALARVQERVEAGDSLRDIARDERIEAEATADELKVQADAARLAAGESLRDLEQAAAASVTDEAGAVGNDVRDIASGAIDEIAGQVGVAAEGVGDQLSGSGEELAAGVAATAAAAGAAAVARATDALGMSAPEADTVDSEATQSSLPPPSSSLPPPGTPPPEATDSAPRDGDRVDGDAVDVDAEHNVSVVELEPDDFAVSSLLDEEPALGPEPIASSSAPASSEPAPAAMGPAPMADSILAPPPSAALRPLPAPARSAVARSAPQPSSAEPEPNGPAPERGPSEPDTFRSLAPPPLAGGILAPPPPVRPLAAPAPSVPSRGSAEDVAEPDDGAPDDAAPAEDGRGFSLAPPPAYGALGSDRN